MRYLTLLLLLPLLAGCRNPDVREDAVVSPPDTAVVDGPLYDPGEVDPADEPGVTRAAAETEARRTILADPTVTEAQVLVADDTVRVTAVLIEPGVDDAEHKAHMFTVAAFRHLERPSVLPEGNIIGPSRFAYDVTIRDQAGEQLFRGLKGREDDTVRSLGGR